MKVINLYCFINHGATKVLSDSPGLVELLVHTYIHT